MSTDEKNKEYIDFLDRYRKKHKLGQWEAHQHALCREVAKEYGLTEEEITWLDQNL